MILILFFVPFAIFRGYDSPPMRFGILLLCLIVLLLLTAVLPIGGGRDATDVYYSPVLLLLLALLSGSSVWCCFKRRFSAKRIGFYLVHLGVVAILAGAFIGYLAGTKGTLQLSLTPSQPTGRLLTEGGDTLEFGFKVAAEGFEVQFYPPLYQLFRSLPPDQIRPGQMPFERAGELDAGRDKVWKIGGAEFAVSNLRKDGAWVERHRLDDGSVLFRGPQTPSYFGVTLLIDGKKLPVSINHPAGYKGWRFYLMSYDQMARRFVQISARRDPGRNTVIAGIWITMAGTFLLGFRREKGGAA